jgi:hypothetical protein
MIGKAPIGGKSWVVSALKLATGTCVANVSLFEPRGRAKATYPKAYIYTEYSKSRQDGREVLSDLSWKNLSCRLRPNGFGGMINHSM